MEGEETAVRVDTPITGPSGHTGPVRGSRVAAPRLARCTIHLADGHRVGLAVCGRGVPLVVVHGYSAEGFLYAQTLSRLVGMGFKVIAIDTAGHGTTRGLPQGGARLGAYTDLLGRAVDELGVKRAVVAGHSMGGRLVAELAATRPDRTIGVLLLDAIVGDPWDTIVDVSRFAPGVLAGVGAALAIDTMTTLPLLRDPVQAAKLGRLLTPVVWGGVRHPWRLVGPGISILRSRGSRWMLQRLAQERVPVYAIHGDRDLAVPLATARASARQARGELVVVHGAGHSWLLKDPETLPAIVNRLLKGSLRDAIDTALTDEGFDSGRATVADVERAFYEPDAKVLELTPPLTFDTVDVPRRLPRFRFTHTDEGQPGPDERTSRRAGCLRFLLP